MMHREDWPAIVFSSASDLLQDTQELEEVLSERLQQLPQPLSGRGSEAALRSMEQNEELFTLDAEQRQELTDRQTSLVNLHSLSYASKGSQMEGGISKTR